MATVTKSRRRVVADPSPEQIAAECDAIRVRRLAEFDQRADRKEAAEKEYRKRIRDKRRAQRKAAKVVIADLMHRGVYGLASAVAHDEARESGVRVFDMMVDGKRDMTKADICNVDVASLHVLNLIPESDDDRIELGLVDPHDIG